jgi:hypothetical protein
VADGRIDKQLESPGGDLNCPHWRSVFSSVFKEPKLGARTVLGGVRMERTGAALVPSGLSGGVTRP